MSVKLTPGLLGRAQIVAGKDGIVTSRDDVGVVYYGPYESRSPGRYRVTFDVRPLADVAPQGDPVCLYLDVVTANGLAKLAERFVLFSQLSNPGVLQLDFELHEPRVVEYRMTTEGQVAMHFGSECRVDFLGSLSRLAADQTPLQRQWQNESEFLDGYLRNVTGLIHVGANLGQERRYYWLLGLDVVWVEPIREVYDKLVDNISRYPRQRAFNALLTARDGERVEFKIANNNGASSSILEFQDHASLFPDVSYTERRIITSTTLVDLISHSNLPLEQYSALTLDVEGAEKVVLEGARSALKNFRYIKCEVADFPARTGTPTVEDLAAIIEPEGFRQLSRRAFATGPDRRGTYWDVVWKRENPGEPLHTPGVPLPLVMNPTEVEALEKCE